MKIWIICTGEPEELWPKRCGAEAFETLCRRRNEGGLSPREEKKISGEDRRIYLAPCASARETAELCVSGGERIEEALLAPVELRAFRETGEASTALWREMARIQRSLGAKGQPESRRQLAARAEQLLSRLEEEEKDCVLVADCILTESLLDRARVRGYTQARTGIFRYRPFERILLTRRDMHCGGCQHNCLLKNPGCGVGKDKAARGY